MEEARNCIDWDRAKKDGELLPPCGDLRAPGNGWLRKAFRDTALKRVPRESQMRALVAKLCKKGSLCARV